MTTLNVVIEGRWSLRWTAEITAMAPPIHGFQFTFSKYRRIEELTEGMAGNSNMCSTKSGHGGIHSREYIRS